MILESEFYLVFILHVIKLVKCVFKLLVVTNVCDHQNVFGPTGLEEASVPRLAGEELERSEEELSEKLLTDPSVEERTRRQKFVTEMNVPSPRKLVTVTTTSQSSCFW